MPKGPKIEVNYSDGMVIIEILDDLTSSGEKAMEETYQKVCKHDFQKALIKFKPQKRVNSGGIALLIVLLTRIREKGCRIFITDISDYLREIFELVGLTKYAKLIDSEEEIE